MLVKQLFQGCKGIERVLFKVESYDVKNICRDSREVVGGDIFFCLSSDAETAKQYCNQALVHGAKIVLSEFEIEDCLKVENIRSVFSRACSNFYGNCWRQMKMVAVCGTNGKTSISHIIGQILYRNGNKVAVIGTNGVFFNGEVWESPLTTPDADFLHRTFYNLKKSGCEFVVMEVSAHAVEQKRIDGIFFDVAVLTNITHDHLDYFESFEKYKQTKQSFFTKEHIKHAVVCVDDVHCLKLAQELNLPTSTYGLKNPADNFAIDQVCALNGSAFVANVMDSVFQIKTNLVGEFNVLNTIAALSVCKLLGLNDFQLSTATNFVNPVAGRFNVYDCGGKFAVVDYAHTPDGLINVLKSCRDLTSGKILLVFGCGGNRDVTKRAEMGKIAQEFADFICLTNDNPRFEVPIEIIQDIEKGMTKEHFIEMDRALAIKKMLGLAKEGDIVIIAGKGAEKYQEIMGVKHLYSDQKVVEEYLLSKDERGSVQ